MEPIKILIEDEWCAEDIIDHCESHKQKYRIVPQKEILSMDADDFLSGPFFCSTHAIQKKLKEKNLHHLVPDNFALMELRFGHGPQFTLARSLLYTQEQDKPVLPDFYKRTITKTTYSDLNKFTYPYFIKSAGNNKLIPGTVINNDHELSELWKIHNITPTADLELYISDVVKFNVEYRLFIGNGRLYATAYQKGVNSIKVDNDFVKELLSVCGKKFYCIDVGYIKTVGWAIVEVNPPFALDDYDIETETYVQYGVDFWLNEVTPHLVILDRQVDFASANLADGSTADAV